MDMNEALATMGAGVICTSAAIIRDGKVLLGFREYRKKWEGKLIAESVWTTPGGRSDPGEDIETGLRREVEEETGITDLRIVSFLGDIDGAKAGDQLFVFHCETPQEPRLMEPEKFREWAWFPLSDIPEPFINSGFPPLIRELGRQ